MFRILRHPLLLSLLSPLPIEKERKGKKMKAEPYLYPNKTPT
jgi:hypothetical protein